MEEVAPEPEASQDTEPVDGALMVYAKFLGAALVVGGGLLIVWALWPTERSDGR